MRPVGPPLPGVMVGNKCEYRDGTIETRSEVMLSDAQKLANEMGLGYYETSAANNTGVSAPFEYIAREFYKRYVMFRAVTIALYCFCHIAHLVVH